MIVLDQDDINSLALCAWKEARGEGQEGMQAVMHVIFNRAGHPGFASTIHDVIYGKNQFSSMSVTSDPEFNLQPASSDPQYAYCLSIATSIQTDPDPTLGAHYYEYAAAATSGWFARVIIGDPVNHPFRVKIGRQNFYV